MSPALSRDTGIMPGNGDGDGVRLSLPQSRREKAGGKEILEGKFFLRFLLALSLTYCKDLSLCLGPGFLLFSSVRKLPRPLGGPQTDPLPVPHVHLDLQITALLPI